MGNWLNDIGVKLTFRGYWDASSGDFPPNPNAGDWWIADNTGTMIDVVPSPVRTLSVSSDDHFMFTGVTFTMVSSVGGSFVYFEGTVVPTGYTASPSENVFVDTSNTALTLKLPASPNMFDRVDIISAAPTYETNNLTIDPQGWPIGGIVDTFVISQNNLSVTAYWIGGTLGWIVVERGDAVLNTIAIDSGISYYVDVADTGGIGHNHYSYLTDAEVRDLIDGTVLSVAKQSSLSSAHSHLLTYTYSNSLFEITVDSNHVGQEHTALVLGFQGQETPWILFDEISAGSPPQPLLAQAFDSIIVDTTVIPLTIRLPISPVLNARITIIPGAPTYSTNALTIDNNGNAIGGVIDSVEVNVDGMSLEFIWRGGSLGWVVTERGSTIIV